MSEVVENLFAETLRGDYEDEAPWVAVRKLRQLGTREVFEIARSWCRSDDPVRRARGVDVLAQLGKTAEHPENAFPEESYSAVMSVICHEKNARPLNSSIAALGHLDDPRAVPMIAKFRSHPNAVTRFAVACALGSFPNEALSLEALLSLMRDSDEDVRDWATFGVGSLSSADSAEIREALVQRLSDANEDVREEAMVGLAERRDSRVLPPLLSALEQSTLSSRVEESAYLMLDLDEAKEGWAAVDYVSALREKFAGRIG